MLAFLMGMQTQDSLEGHVGSEGRPGKSREVGSRAFLPVSVSLSIQLSFCLRPSISTFVSIVSLSLKSLMHIYSNLLVYHQPFFSPSSFFPFPHSCSLHMALVRWSPDPTQGHPITNYPCLSLPIPEGGTWPWDFTTCQSFAFCSCLISHRLLKAGIKFTHHIKKIVCELKGIFNQ